MSLQPKIFFLIIFLIFFHLFLISKTVPFQYFVHIMSKMYLIYEHREYFISLVIKKGMVDFFYHSF